MELEIAPIQEWNDRRLLKLFLVGLVLEARHRMIMEGQTPKTIWCYI